MLPDPRDASALCEDAVPGCVRICSQPGGWATKRLRVRTCVAVSVLVLPSVFMSTPWLPAGVLGADRMVGSAFCRRGEGKAGRITSYIGLE